MKNYNQTEIQNLSNQQFTYKTEYDLNHTILTEHKNILNKEADKILLFHQNEQIQKQKIENKL